MRIGTINLNHRARKPSTIHSDLFQALDRLDTDLLFLTECVPTPEMMETLGTIWTSILASEQLKYDNRGRWSNQVVALSKRTIRQRHKHPPIPTQCASTNFLAIQLGDIAITGLRAPFYQRASDWYDYWNALNQRLDGDVVIGDLNVDPRRNRKRDRVLPDQWSLITPAGSSYRSTPHNTESALDHVLLADGLYADSCAYRDEFLGRWGLDHCPLVVDIQKLN